MSKTVYLISTFVIIGSFLIYKFVFQKMFGLNKSKDRIRDATPAVTTPAVTTPAVTTPAVTTPAVTTPAVTTPAVTTPAVTTPAVTTPAVTRPAVTRPAVTTPAVTTPAVTTPAVTRPAVTTPAVTRPAVTTPAVTRPAVTTPAVTRPAVTTPAVTRPAPTTPASTTPAPTVKPKVIDKVKDEIVKVKDTLTKSVGRGVGKPIHTCKSNEEKNGLLCYPKCENIDGVSTTGVGPVCWQNCPPSFTDNGVFCLKPKAYDRGGRIVDATCPSGWKKAGVGVVSKCGKIVNWKAVTQPTTKSCRSDEEMSAGFCFPKCKPGYHGIGPVCSPNCPSGFGTDIGISCTKKSKGRGIGKPLGCAENEENDAALCYPKCNDVQGVKDVQAKNPGLQFNGVGPVCWPKI
jgi:hypothetical protein